MANTALSAIALMDQSSACQWLSSCNGAAEMRDGSDSSKVTTNLTKLSSVDVFGCRFFFPVLITIFFPCLYISFIFLYIVFFFSLEFNDLLS